MAQITRKQQQQLAKLMGLPAQATIDEIVAAAPSGDHVTVEQQVTHLESFQGPLPSPKLLRDYAEVVPQLPDRIVRMAETEQNHRHEIEKAIVAGQLEDIRSRRTEIARGQIFGFGLAVAAMICGTVLLAKGATASGLTAFFSGIALIAGSFIYKAVTESKAPKEKHTKQPKAVNKDES